MQGRLGGDRLLGVPAAGHAEVGHDPPADPRRHDLGPDGVDDTGHLAAGGHRRLGPRERAAVVAAADRRVHQVDAHGLARNANLRSAWLQVGDLFELQDVGRTELVLADGAHDADATISSSLEVKTPGSVPVVQWSSR